MKKRLKTIYYLIPVTYVAVIGFFLFMQFRSQESFQEELGALSLKGSYSKSIGGRRQLRSLTMDCSGVRLELGRQPLLLEDPGPARSRRIRIQSYSRIEQGVEVACSEGLDLRFTLHGPSGVQLEPHLPEGLQGIRFLSLPLQLGADRAEWVRGIPLLRLSGRSGTRYAALPAGSAVDLKKGRLEVHLLGNEKEPRVLFDRVEGSSDEPYAFWFSRQGPLAGEGQYAERLAQYLDKSYRYWNRVVLARPDDPALAGAMGTALLSEAVERGDYRRLLPAVASALREAQRAGPSSSLGYSSSAFIGYLQGYLAAAQRRAEELIPRLTEAIRRSDPAVLQTPELIRFIVNRAPLSLAEEVLRLADSVDRSGASPGTLLDLLEVYAGAARFFDRGPASRQKAEELIDGWLLPSLVQTPEGLFLARLTGEREGQVDLLECARAGRLFLRAAEWSSRSSLALLGRNLLLAALALADSEGFVPRQGVVQAGHFSARGEALPPEVLYPLVAAPRHFPEEHPLFADLGPGAWLYTAAELEPVKVDAGRQRFTFAFPLGQPHYFILQGVRPMSSVVLHEILWKPDPQFSLYTDGWSYDPESQTLLGKITHRKRQEELVIEY